ncbi:MAG: methionyl-tRNA formyltransferase [Oligoflexia bacterium]|nr:methionyl-tRNA formyltransferase [Oligoflexia bacterium]
MAKPVATVQKTKVVFMGTPEFACSTFNMLLSNQDIFEICAVITQPDKPAGRDMEVQRSAVKEMAEKHLMTLSKVAKKFPILTPENINSTEALRSVKEIMAHVAIVVAYGQLLSAEFLKLFDHGAVNVHASLLPRWRGAAPIQWCILSQDSVTGVTLQKVAPKLDSGDIIAQSQIVIDESWDAPKLYADLARRGADLVKKFVPEYVKGAVKPQPQDESLVTWAPKIKKEQGLIDWQKHAKIICAQIRALTPWPGTWTTREGKVVKILRATWIQYDGGQIGELVGLDKMNFWVQCGEKTALQVSVVQPESRSRMPVAEYVKGYPFKKGDRLGT